jgi:hypothetical protein
VALPVLHGAACWVSRGPHILVPPARCATLSLSCPVFWSLQQGVPRSACPVQCSGPSSKVCHAQLVLSSVLVPPARCATLSLSWSLQQVCHTQLVQPSVLVPPARCATRSLFSPVFWSLQQGVPHSACSGPSSKVCHTQLVLVPPARCATAAPTAPPPPPPVQADVYWSTMQGNVRGHMARHRSRWDTPDLQWHQ